jgi:lipopolysaccharide export system permease protein
MVVLALPFAYLHFRSGGITSYVFGGVLIGISFFLLNNVFGYIGNLQNWMPWLAAGRRACSTRCCRWARSAGWC